MKINISNDKEKLINFVTKYLTNLISNVDVDMIINGEKLSGIITDVKLNEYDGNDYISVYVNGDKRDIPITDSTKGTLGRELVVFETNNHSTVIEIL